MECMNVKCGAKSSSSEREKGWPLRSGGFATLCDHCGSAYKQLIFCETFHSEDTGWRDCDSCGKRLHCGCIASSSSLELLDTGGVICDGCSTKSVLSAEKTEACDIAKENSTGPNLEKTEGDANETPSQEHFQLSKINDTTPTNQEENGHRLLSIFDHSSKISSTSYDLLQGTTSLLNVHKSSVETDLSINFPATSNSTMATKERESIPSIFSLERGSKTHHQFTNPILASGFQANSSSYVSTPQLRVARPPAEGRVKSQLLPRYWPRITDQELQQISGDSNSTIVPLFEKVLSASDAGRIGRLVLPKACAEAYFPPISQPEGLPLKIQDVKGREWVFQFRFWPNNNSRMYVLEGVTPCIHSMQLQAGDTVTFSRMDPEGKLMMGFRKASNNMMTQQDSEGELVTAAENNLPIIGGYSGLLQPLKGSRSPPVTFLSKHVSHGIEKETSKSGDDINFLALDRKRSRNIGSKGGKRLHIDEYDAVELRLSWEEINDMLLPPPTVEPSTISIEEYDFEEFNEPPVFGKRGIFVSRLSGEQEQWAQCDSCSKWRKLHVDFLLPSQWTCRDNVNDPTRNSCSAPDELDAQELENLLKMDKEFRNRRLEAAPTSSHEPPNPPSEPAKPSVAMTTRHPRHRPGCSCIVCIQPPSGKGKHKPACTCNVCMTVKRRFKTLMMRKKKRQIERESEIIIARRSHSSSAKEEAAEADCSSFRGKSSEIDGAANSEFFRIGLDLNRENAGPSPRVSMIGLLREANLPLDSYLKENGLTSLAPEQRETAEDDSSAAADAAKEVEEEVISGKSSSSN